MIVVADTSPLNYLIQIQCEHVLPQLYRAVIIPMGVIEELRSPKAPSAVKAWIERLPDWLEVRALTSGPNPELNHLGRGEREAIQLAEEQRASLLLIDERKGRSEAALRGLSTTGTLGVVLDAGEAGLIDPSQAYRRLIEETTFRTSPALETHFLRRFRQ
jgi:predicted nucleic acid-binding protein